MSYELDDELQAIVSKHDATTIDDLIILSKGLLEQRLNLCRTDQERQQLYPQMVQSISVIEKMVHDAQKYRERTSEMLSRATVMQMATSLVEIITKYLKLVPNSDDIIAAAAAEIMEVISNAKNKPEE